MLDTAGGEASAGVLVQVGAAGEVDESSVSWRNSSAWWTEAGPTARTPMGWSRTSQPWQYGQCTTPWPQCRPARGPRAGRRAARWPPAGGARRAAAVGQGDGETEVARRPTGRPGRRRPPRRRRPRPRSGAPPPGPAAASRRPAPVAAEQAVHRRSRGVARGAAVDHDNRAAGAGQHQRAVQARGARRRSPLRRRSHRAVCRSRTGSSRHSHVILLSSCVAPGVRTIWAASDANHALL